MGKRKVSSSSSESEDEKPNIAQNNPKKQLNQLFLKTANMTSKNQFLERVLKNSDYHVPNRNISAKHNGNEKTKSSHYKNKQASLQDENSSSTSSEEVANYVLPKAKINVKEKKMKKQEVVSNYESSEDETFLFDLKKDNISEDSESDSSNSEVKQNVSKKGKPALLKLGKKEPSSSENDSKSVLVKRTSVQKINKNYSSDSESESESDNENKSSVHIQQKIMKKDSCSEITNKDSSSSESGSESLSDNERKYNIQLQQTKKNDSSLKIKKNDSSSSESESESVSDNKKNNSVQTKRKIREKDSSTSESESDSDSDNKKRVNVQLRKTQEKDSSLKIKKDSSSSENESESASDNEKRVSVQMIEKVKRKDLSSSESESESGSDNEKRVSVQEIEKTKKKDSSSSESESDSVSDNKNRNSLEKVTNRPYIKEEMKTSSNSSESDSDTKDERKTTQSNLKQFPKRKSLEENSSSSENEDEETAKVNPSLERRLNKVISNKKSSKDSTKQSRDSQSELEKRSSLENKKRIEQIEEELKNKLQDKFFSGSDSDASTKSRVKILQNVHLNPKPTELREFMRDMLRFSYTIDKSNAIVLHCLNTIHMILIQTERIYRGAINKLRGHRSITKRFFDCCTQTISVRKEKYKNIVKVSKERLEMSYPGIKQIKTNVELNFSGSEDLYLFRIPKNVDPYLLMNANFDFENEFKLKIGEKYNVKPTTKVPDPTLVVSDNCRVIRFKSNIKMVKHIKSNKEPEIVIPEKKTVPLPENLKNRHPLFGSDFENKITLSKTVENKLDDVIANLLRKEEKIKKKKHKKKKLEQQEEEKQKEEIFDYLESHSSAKRINKDTSEDSAFSSSGSMDKVNKKNKKSKQNILDEILKNIKKEYDSDSHRNMSPKKKRKYSTVEREEMPPAKIKKEIDIENIKKEVEAPTLSNREKKRASIANSTLMLDLSKTPQFNSRLSGIDLEASTLHKKTKRKNDLEERGSIENKMITDILDSLKHNITPPKKTKKKKKHKELDN